MPVPAAATTRIIGITSVNILTNNAGTIVKTPVPFSNNVKPNPKNTTISYEGDNQKIEYVTLDGITFDVTADYLDDATLATLHTAATATGLPTDTTKRIYVGSTTDGAGTVGLEVNLSGRDTTTQVTRNLRITVFRCAINQIGKSIDDLKNKAKTGIMFTMTALKTTTDVTGTALGGVPTDGAYYGIDTLNI